MGYSPRGRKESDMTERLHFHFHAKMLPFPGGAEGKASARNAGELGSIPGWGRFPWRRKWQPTPVFLPGEPHGWRSLVGYSPRVRKESDMTERLNNNNGKICT